MSEQQTAPGQQSLQLILARNLISTLSTAAFIVDTSETVVFYNEAAGEFLGMRYEETGKLALRDWRRALGATGGAVPEDRLPVSVALRERRPVHLITRVRPGDVERSIDMLALPLISTDDQHEGAIGLFWLHVGDES